MKYPKGFKNPKTIKPKRIKQWSKSDLDVTWTDDERVEYLKQLEHRVTLMSEIFWESPIKLSRKEVVQVVDCLVTYTQWSLYREKVMIGRILTDTLHPHDLTKK